MADAQTTQVDNFQKKTNIFLIKSSKRKANASNLNIQEVEYLSLKIWLDQLIMWFVTIMALQAGETTDIYCMAILAGGILMVNGLDSIVS